MSKLRVNDSITVSSVWELTSVYMRYSQGNGVHTSLSRLVLYPRSVFSECISVCVDYPQHGHVLYGTIMINTCVYIIYTCRVKVPAPIKDHLIDHPVEA